MLSGPPTKKSDKRCGTALATFLMRRQPKYKCRAKAKEAAIDAGESTAKNKDAGVKRAGKGRG